ncbi:hypothetical protein GKE82_26130 [Conexibacter sp. W3-3-2]|uniref:hypothetical protein n=1 Tax=Conexibacter sp. W3-3-2 TaxID=2675227 RepID=UPI0012B797F4|nr:hypothetical protein [Conexibacter sp. W3-3-2]MTD47684.1 hypothetical protein [Conexibacter sp. W3-3-2]
MRCISDAEWATITESLDLLLVFEQSARTLAGEEASLRFRWYVVDNLERGIAQPLELAVGRLLTELGP